MSKLIKCPHCKRGTDPSVPFCMNCGKEISLNDDQITSGFKESIKSERQRETQYYIRGMLVFVIFMFVAALVFAFSVSSEPVQDIKPAYPIVSPDEDTIDGYTPGDTINSDIIDSIGGPFHDFEYPAGNVIDDILNGEAEKKNSNNADEDK